jgi:hypothetical protein
LGKNNSAIFGFSKKDKQNMNWNKNIVIVFCFSLWMITWGCASNQSSQPIPSFQSKNQVESSVSLNWPWRGITIVSHDKDDVKYQDIEKLASYGVNFVRLRLSFRKLMEAEKIDFESAYERTISWALEIILSCNKHNIDVLISHSDFPVDPKKKFIQTDSKFWNDANELNKALKVIDNIVLSFDTCNAVKAYQFIAEPVTIINGKSKQPNQWLDYFEQIRTTVRNRSVKYLVFSPGPWGKTAGYKNMGIPFNDTAIIYNFHFYEPHRYTHQNIRSNNEIYSYPNSIGKIYWDREKLAEKIDIFQNWRITYKIKYAFGGEFSAVRWAEGKEDYLKDVIELLEERNISWSYFSYNGWPGWNYNYEHDNSRSFLAKNLILSEKETGTLRLLKKYWKLNLEK